MRMIEYYHEANKEITIILNMADVNKSSINIDFLFKFINKFKKHYEHKIIMRKFYIINCPSSLKKVYLFIKPFLHIDTQNKIQLIKEDKTQSIESYYYD